MSGQDILLETGTNELEIIEFFVHEKTEQGPRTHYFGVNVAKVLEVVEAPEGLEGSEAATHPSFLGTIPLRDLILPVVDLSVWLNVERAKSVNEPIIVTEFNATITGFLVSGVTQIHRVNWKDVEPPSKYVASMDTNCITGTVQLNDRFVLMLDLERMLADLDGDSQAHSSGPGVYSEERYRALVADDSTSVRELLRRNFTEANFEVTLVGDGAEAWDRLLAIKARVEQEGGSPLDHLDAVVSDIEMPRMDGYTLTRKIKEDPVLKVLPVALFSSLISKGVEHKGHAVKADAQVTKPEFHGLTAKVIDLIRRWKAEAAA
ncbi:MAG: chemotaxis protein [Pseudodesulfovibrio sp.]|uniref:CheW domain protein n=1 Tax=Pseudodesulfovibrio aespoeensis (strain ATCC 700646 / DSM 10631 / Aspo-2) TaxID=643562 RepID=E6VZ91_PSEA9|nr:MULTISPECIES: chemotaxis protein [Pseudodesulfovibrio]MBU4192692.1 chemotaxis protein [Pseudomonadota bacterium]ADU63963.1 CheW domain protein [Pseudodesulfovibrio aespoeensis Aspo-2]MBU4244179.1 chemotaxis protein [Pseudomonadota bacterium]MBU4379266.1 chemotaxis protein [Pseudomonadota bacterium]MBU4474369.1 chemotaxis protein [Pseudomonadota bacterium]